MNSPQLQIARFPDGGFVLHKITFPMFAGRFSAWFDAKGELLDAEHFDSLNRARPVKRDGIKWGFIRAAGQRHIRQPETV